MPLAPLGDASRGTVFYNLHCTVRIPLIDESLWLLIMVFAPLLVRHQDEEAVLIALTLSSTPESGCFPEFIAHIYMYGLRTDSTHM